MLEIYYSIFLIYVLMVIFIIIGIIQVVMKIVGHRRPLLPEYRLVKYWRDDIAKYYYRLEVRDEYNMGYDETEEIGNFKWAQRQSKHHKCEIVGENE